MSKDEELEQLRQENAVLREQVALLSERISELEARLAKDSHNSHLPPSSDRFHRQPKSLRKKSEQKPGGQPGHPGSTLRLTPRPDLVVLHPVEHCEHWKPDLREVASLQVERRQVLDLPPKRVVVIDIRPKRSAAPAVSRSAPRPSPRTYEPRCSMEPPLGRWASTWCSNSSCPMNEPVKWCRICWDPR